eukprot:3554339-Rhodomonas_salina.3
MVSVFLSLPPSVSPSLSLPPSLRPSVTSSLLCHSELAVFGVVSAGGGCGEAGGVRRGRVPVSYTHLTLPTICSV